MKHLSFTKLRISCPTKTQLDFREWPTNWNFFFMLLLIFFYDYIDIDYLSSDSGTNYI